MAPNSKPPSSVQVFPSSKTTAAPIRPISAAFLSKGGTRKAMPPSAARWSSAQGPRRAVRGSWSRSTSSILTQERSTARPGSRGAAGGARDKIPIDDFGTAPTSLAFLGKLSIRELKIGLSLISIKDNKDNHAVVRGGIKLAHKLGYVVTAEGAENKAILEILKTLGCDSTQGHYFSHPVSADELMRRLNDPRGFVLS